MNILKQMFPLQSGLKCKQTGKPISYRMRFEIYGGVYREMKRHTVTIGTTFGIKVSKTNVEVRAVENLSFSNTECQNFPLIT